MEEIKLNLDNLTIEEREQLMKLVEKGNQTNERHSKSEIWKPLNGENYYFIRAEGTVDYYGWNNDTTDERQFKCGNCYRTKEEAEFVLEKRQVEVELQRFSDKNNEGIFDIFDTEIDKYYIKYDLEEKEIAIDYRNYALCGEVVFSSKVIAEQAINAIGADRIKKYIFGVK